MTASSVDTLISGVLRLDDSSWRPGEVAIDGGVTLDVGEATVGQAGNGTVMTP